MVTETAYNTRGEVVYSSGPNWDESAPPGGTFVRVEQGADHSRTWFTYDPLGREVRSELWLKNVKLWETTTSYGGSTLGYLVRATPPDGGVATGTVTDAHGQIVEQRDYHGGTAAGTYDATRYAYDYDLRGRVVASHDPDSGSTTAAYDAAGRLVASTDARGETVSRVHDVLGRPIQLWDGEAGSGELVSEWTYDTMPGGIGLPATATTYVDGHEILTTVGNYDQAGRPTSTTVRVPPIPGLEALAGVCT